MHYGPFPETWVLLEQQRKSFDCHVLRIGAYLYEHNCYAGKRGRLANNSGVELTVAFTMVHRTLSKLRRCKMEQAQLLIPDSVANPS